MKTPQELELTADDMAREIENFDLSAAMRACRDVVWRQVDEEFALEQGPLGEPWKPWYWTSEYPPRPHKTLQFSGMLAASFLTQQAGHVEEVGKNFMTFGSEVKYANIHQEGATFTLGIWLFGREGGVKKPGSTITIPARPMVGWPDDTIAACEELIAQAFIAEFQREDYTSA